MRINPDECRDPDLLAKEVRRLNAVIAAGEPALTAEEREAIEWAVSAARNVDHPDEDTLRKLLARLA